MRRELGRTGKKYKGNCNQDILPNEKKNLFSIKGKKEKKAINEE